MKLPVLEREIETVRVGVVGLGSMGRNHVRVLDSMPGVELAGIYDVQDAMHLAQRDLFCRSFDDLLDRELDYLTIATPTNTHVDLALRALDARVPCLIEKPVALDSASAQILADRFEGAGVLAGVGQVERYNSGVWEARRRIRAGELGQIMQISTRRVGPFPARIGDVGVILDLATHDIDATVWLLDSPYDRIFAEIDSVLEGPHEDALVALGRLRSGVVATHVVNWISPYKQREITITGELGAFRIDTLVGSLTIFNNGSVTSEWTELAQFAGVTQGDVIIPEIQRVEPLVREHQEFVAAMRGQDGAVATLKEASLVLETCEELGSYSASPTAEPVGITKD